MNMGLELQWCVKVRPDGAKSLLAADGEDALTSNSSLKTDA
jgi:hypothetical protein